jgi:hypothetical protein
MKQDLLHEHYSGFIPYPEILKVLKKKYSKTLEFKENRHLKFSEDSHTIDWNLIYEKVDERNWNFLAAMFYHIIKSKNFFEEYHLLILKQLKKQKVRNIEFRIRLGSFRGISIEEELKMFYDILPLYIEKGHQFKLIAQACKTDPKERYIPYFEEINKLYKKHSFVRELICGFDLACSEDVRGLKQFDFLVKKMLMPPIFHAGEHGKFVESNIQFCIASKCKRIGHGIYAAKYPKLLQELKENNICLELCPISNLLLAITKTEEELIEMYSIIFMSGIPYCINSDDPNKLQDTDIDDNYEWCKKVPGFNKKFSQQCSIMYSCS